MQLPLDKRGLVCYTINIKCKDLPLAQITEPVNSMTEIWRIPIRHFKGPLQPVATLDWDYPVGSSGQTPEKTGLM